MRVFSSQSDSDCDDVFNAHMPTPNQISRAPDSVQVSARDLLGSPTEVSGGVTLAGLKANIDVGLEYTESWLRGLGCVPLHNLVRTQTEQATGDDEQGDGDALVPL